jgi:hypothetical protein
LLVRQHADGVDINSMAVNPLFVDPANGDFRFKQASAAHGLGISPIDLSSVGLRKS